MFDVQKQNFKKSFLPYKTKHSFQTLCISSNNSKVLSKKKWAKKTLRPMLFFEVKIWGQTFDLEKVILVERSIKVYKKLTKFHDWQCWNYINISKNKKVTAILIFGVGLEAENFEGPYLGIRRSWQPQILVLGVSFKP